MHSHAHRKSVPRAETAARSPCIAGDGALQQVAHSSPTVARLAMLDRYANRVGAEPIVQGQWDDDSTGIPADRADEQFGKPLKEDEGQRVADLCAELERLIDAHQTPVPNVAPQDQNMPEQEGAPAPPAAPAKKPILFYLGVGTGNPMSARGNPTGGVDETIKHQTEPGFLAEARASYYVIAVNCNPGLGDTTSATADGVLMNRAVALPLVLDSAADKSASQMMRTVRNKVLDTQGRFVVMNAVTEKYYAALHALTSLKGKEAKQSTGRVSYLTSYMATREQSTRNVTMSALNNNFVRTNKRPNGFASMSDVFPPKSKADDEKETK